LPATGRALTPGRRGPGVWFVAPAVFVLVVIGLLPFI
jgi:hypothetical protein